LILAISIVHVIVCLALVMIILLQTGKGADMGAIFGGGGSQTLFGSTGASTFFGKLTTVAAVVFMLTCLSLAYISSHKRTVMPAGGEPAAQEETVAPSGETDAGQGQEAGAESPGVSDQAEESGGES